jgi:ATP synthase protein I
LVVSWELAYSAFIGGLIATFANLYSARRIFAPYRAQRPDKLLKRLYGTEIKKFLLTLLMFVGAIAWIDPLSIPAMFGLYIGVQLVPLLVAATN